LLDNLSSKPFEILTPLAASQRGSQLSIIINERPRALLAALEANSLVSDFREPNVIRVAPAPLYNTFQEVWRFADILGRVFTAAGRG
jgi:kynureninase